MFQRRLAVAVRAAICVALACTALTRIPQAPATFIAPRSLTVTATIVEIGGGDSAESLTVQDADAACRYTVFTPLPGFAPGDRVAVRGVLRPFDVARNPGAFSERDYARKHSLCAAIEHASVALIRHADEQNPRYWPARFRLWGKHCINRIFPSDEANVLTGMLWGDHHAMTYADASAFSATGTSHLLVTAGLHIGLFTGIAALLLRLLTVERSLACAFTIAIACMACIVSDAHIPSVRATTMIATFLCARMLGTEATSLRTLCCAFCLTIAIDPDALLDAGCYLSFSCVFAIVHLAEALEEYLAKRGIPRFIATSLALTLAAEIGTWALIAVDFNQISIIAPFANLIAVPLAMLTLATAPVLLSGAAIHVNALTMTAALPMHWLLMLLLSFIRFCAHLPFAALTVRAPAVWTVVLYECTLIIACRAGNARTTTRLLALAHRLRGRMHLAELRAFCIAAAYRSTQRMRFGTMLCVVASLCVGISAFAHARVLRITVLDVGQGDGIVIETPNGHTLLVDTGGKLELHAEHAAESPAETAAARVLLPFLRYEGVTHIDLLLLTHPHGDHAGGAAPLLRALPVGVFLDSGQSYAGRAYRDALRAAADAHVPRLLARRGETISFDDGVALHILAPEEPLFRGGRNDVNENSIVAMLTYQYVRVLFTGDAGFQSERRLLAHNDDLHADILKVGHHGSAFASSDAFLAAVRPHYALISVGRHNLFHHPAFPTLVRLSAATAHVYRTDRCGAICVEDHIIGTMLPCEVSTDVR